MGDFYGRPCLYVLESHRGFLCYRWWVGDRIGVVLFSDTKTALAWVKEVNKMAFKHGRDEWWLEVKPRAVKFHPLDLQPAINPSGDFSDVARIMNDFFWRDGW